MNKAEKKKLRDKYRADELVKESLEGWGPGGGGSLFELDGVSDEEVDEMIFQNEEGENK